MPGPGPTPRAPRTSGRHQPFLRSVPPAAGPRSLPRLRGLPDLGEVVPLELDVAEAGGVGDPGPDQIGAGRDHPYHEPAAPVVPPQNDPTPPGLQLCP